MGDCHVRLPYRGGRVMSAGEGVGAGEDASTTQTVDALGLLALPSLDDLTDRQVRGTTCVWDSALLTTETAVDLGERMSALSGTTSPMRWFPRACHRCVHTAAYAALMDHAPLCEQCVDEAAGCDTAVGLRRLMREHRR